MNDLDLLEALWATPTATDAVGAEARHEASAITGLQRQGDLLLIPLDQLPATSAVRRGALRLLVAVRLDGHPITVLEGEHAHRATGGGGSTWAPAVGTPSQTDASLGVLTVPDCGTAWLEHTGHHAPLAVGPGRYVVRRQLAYVPTPVAPFPVPPTSTAPTHRPTPRSDEAPAWRTVWD